MDASVQSNEVNVEPLQSDPQDVIHLPPTEQQLQQQQLQQQRGEQERTGHDTPSDKPIDVDIDDDEEEDDDEDYEGDDDEEKDNSQKLVIDLNEDDKDEDEEDEEEEKGMMEQNEAVALELIKSESQQAQEKDELSEVLVEKPAILQRTDVVDNIITLSDAEDEIAAVDATTKPGKIQKRKSVGAPTAAANEEERYRLKRRKINVEGAPKMPLTGYVRYMNDRRESARKEYPNKTNIEITKQIGEEWQSLPGNVKAEYLKAAEEDKKRYTSELHTFLKSRPDVLASELAKNKIRKTDNNSANNLPNAKPAIKEKIQVLDNPKALKEANKEKITVKEIHPTPSTSQNADKQQICDKPKRKRTPTPPSTSASSTASAVAPATGSIILGGVSALPTNVVASAPGEIPIFTNEFLEHNKLYDIELRSLRKSKTDLEQQNFVLEKHVENMKCGVEKMVSENNELQEKNRLLEIYLDKLKRKLAVALSSLPLPHAPNGATVENIDKYMQDLYKMSTSNSHGPATLNKAKDIIRKLDLQIQL